MIQRQCFAKPIQRCAHFAEACLESGHKVFVTIHLCRLSVADSGACPRESGELE